jgi:hypothetical protein
MSVLALLLMTVSESVAYAPLKHRWKGNSIQFQIGGLDESIWRGGFIEAAKRWEDTPVDIDIETTNSSRQPACRSNGRNEAWLAATNCGDTWGSRTLAVTSRYYRGRDQMQEADIMYNSSRSWEIYDGHRKSISDFVRVTVHELGHALGVDHSDDRDAIMYPSISNTFLPSIDDLYGMSRGIGYGWESHNKLSINASGDGYIEVRPKVPGTVGMSQDFSESYTDFSRFDCDGNCSHWFQDGLRLSLVAVAINGSSFLGWEGNNRCESADHCNLAPLHTSKSVKAIFSVVEEPEPVSDIAEGADGTSLPRVPELIQVSHDLLTYEVRVEWNAVAGATMYKVLRAGGESAPYLLIRKTGKNAIVDSSIVKGERYYYRVKACNNYGCGKLTRSHPKYRGSLASADFNQAY